MQPPADTPDSELIEATRNGDASAFEPLVHRYQSRIFATARRYARREDEVEDIVQEIFVKAFQRLATYRGDAPFEHWLMRLAVRTCYDFLRRHQRSRETTFTEFSREESDWLETFAAEPDSAPETDPGARQLLQRALEQLSPADRLVLTLVEIEDRPVREVAALTGWSLTLVKVRAFRARHRLRKVLEPLLGHERNPHSRPPL